MKTRPPIGARVRFLHNTGISSLAGLTAIVLWYHADGTAFTVRVDGEDRLFACDPVNVRLAAGEKRRIALLVKS